MNQDIQGLIKFAQHLENNHKFDIAENIIRTAQDYLDRETRTPQKGWLPSGEWMNSKFNNSNFRYQNQNKEQLVQPYINFFQQLKSQYPGYDLDTIKQYVMNHAWNSNQSQNFMQYLSNYLDTIVQSSPPNNTNNARYPGNQYTSDMYVNPSVSQNNNQNSNTVNQSMPVNNMPVAPKQKPLRDRSNPQKFKHEGSFIKYDPRDKEIAPNTYVTMGGDHYYILNGRRYYFLNDQTTNLRAKLGLQPIDYSDPNWGINAYNSYQAIDG